MLRIQLYDYGLASAAEHSPLIKQQIRKWPSILVSLIACTCSVANGFVLGFSSPTETDLHQRGLLPTEEDMSWFVALASLGAMIGAPLAGWGADYCGRKLTILLISLPALSGWLLIIGANGNVMLFVGRLLSGLSLGMTTASVPLYVGEIAISSIRGLLVTAFQIAALLGILTTFSLGIVLKFAWLSVAAVVVVMVSTVGMVFMPETPRWLLKQNRKREALQAATWLLGSRTAGDEELTLIQENLEIREPMSIRELRKRSVFYPLLIGASLAFFQQFSGINAVMANLQDIFTQSGFKDSGAASVIVAAVQVLATAVTAVLIDRLGRRILLISGGATMGISLVSYGVYDYLITKPQPVTGITSLALVSFIIYSIGFSIGWGPIPWIVMSEIFPIRARGLGNGIASCVCWLSSFIVTYQFKNLENAITVHGAFWTFAGINFASVLFVAFFLPETKGRTLEEIESFFSPPRHSEVTAPNKNSEIINEDSATHT